MPLVQARLNRLNVRELSVLLTARRVCRDDMRCSLMARVISIDIQKQRVSSEWVRTAIAHLHRYEPLSQGEEEAAKPLAQGVRPASGDGPVRRAVSAASCGGCGWN